MNRNFGHLLILCHVAECLSRKRQDGSVFRHARPLPVFLLGLFLVLPVGAARAQTFDVDFSRWSGVPLLKTKFGVYQTPFLSQSDLIRSVTLLREAGVRDLRYEMAWGKPDAFAYDQIRGSADAPTVDFTPLDPYFIALRDAGVHPLIALTYDPIPLKKGAEWQRWKDAPSDPSIYQTLIEEYVRHYGAVLQIPGAFYEVWNEPDLPGDGGKVFFNGGPGDYGGVYDAASAGVRAGDDTALSGGAATAYDLAYVKPLLARKTPPDFLSIHAYANYAAQIDNLRSLIANRPELPIFVTEYASYSSFGKTAPVSRHDGAVGFFHDIKGLLDRTDTAKVYWAQWIDDDLGMVTRDFHRKAIFNAYSVYQNMLPVDRNLVQVQEATGLDALAASDGHMAAVVVWNEAGIDRTVTVRAHGFPFRKATARLFRIDAHHASYIDDPRSEALTCEKAWTVGDVANARVPLWQGNLPAGGVVILTATNAAGESLLRPSTVGRVLRPYYWNADRTATTYADFDSRTGIFRLGMGNADNGTAQTGVLLDRVVPWWNLRVLRQGPFAIRDANSLLGIRLDFMGKGGRYSRSVLLHDGSLSAARSATFPWGKGTAADRTIATTALCDGGSFDLDIASLAPSDWNGRLLLTALLQDRGAGSAVRIQLTPRR